MNDLLKIVTQQLSGSATEAISQKIGANKSQTENAIGNALPILLSAMAKNAKSPSGASALAGALDKDHDGSIFNDLTGFVGRSEQGPGAGILKHVLGSKRGVMEQLVGNSSGLNQNATSSLMEILAPVVMGAMGREKRSSGMDSSAIAGMLGAFLSQNKKEHPNNSGLVGQLLDRDGDGSYVDDVASMGVNFLSSLMRK